MSAAGVGSGRARLAFGILAAGIAIGPALGQETAVTAAQDAGTPPAKLPWNAWSFPAIDLQLHVTAMYDGAFFAQDAASVEQVGDISSDGLFRLDNFEVDGQVKWPIPWSFQIAAEYDGADQTNAQRGWTLSDLNVTIPFGRLFAVTLGQQSEGITLERLSNNYDLSFMERSTMSSALTTPRNTGVRFKGTLLGDRMNWSAGWYNGWLTNGLSFSESGNIFNGRIAGLAVDENGGRRLVHLGVWGAYAEAQEGQARSRSRPEVYEAPFFIDTGSVPVSSTDAVGFELAVVEGPVTLTAEYTGARLSAASIGNPRYSGFYVQAAWAPTGETRPYGSLCGCFGQLTPAAPFSFRHGGFGALEVAARYSSTDLNSAAVEGGKIDRWSGALSWFPVAPVRLEFNYGYGTLFKDGLTGRTHFYQLRLQFEI